MSTALIDRLSSSLSSGSAPLVPERRVRPPHGLVIAPGAAIPTVVVTVVGRQIVFVGPDNGDEIREMGMVSTSPNGSTWTRIDTGEQFFTARLTVVAGNPIGAITFAGLRA
jgi:hypothetical protein